MDALKKAELAKRNAQLDNPSSSPSSPPSPGHIADTQTTSAETIQPGFASAHTRTDTASRTETRTEIQADISATQSERFEFIDQGFLSEINRGAKTAKVSSLSLQEIDPQIDPHPAAPLSLAMETEAEGEQQQEAIQNLFEAKKNSQASQTTSSGKIFGIAIGVASLLALVAIGLYFWMELQPKSGLQRGPVTATYQGQETAQSSAVTMPLAPVEKPVSPSATTAVVPTYDEESSSNEVLNTRTNTRTRQSPPEPSKKTFRIASTNPPSNTTLDRAYEALTRGDDDTAKAAYVKTLDADPKNIDALAGLAVISQRAGNTAQAADYYVQMLDADPRNALALSGLINLQSRMDPFEAETRVKQALSTQPDSPALNFTLGNVYARSKRWNEAQQAYFKALTVDPGNPDYLFNLAISLDQLRQPKLAANYYVQAIAAIDNRPGSFDKTKASERLQQLQQ
jgi:Tfp pilus assembly protein PilF